MVLVWGVLSMRDAGSGDGGWGVRERCGLGVISARQRATTLASGGIDRPNRALLNSRPAPSAERANMQPPPRKVSDHLTGNLIRKLATSQGARAAAYKKNNASFNSIAFNE